MIGLNKTAGGNNKNFTYYIRFYLTALAVHFLLPLNWADDAIFFKKSSQLTLTEFLINSARPVIDAATYFFTRYALLWRILNPFMLLLLSLLLSEYLSCRKERDKNIFIGCAVVYPAVIVVDAGFIATTLNYLWPVTSGLLCLRPLWKILHGSKPRWYEMILLLPCLLYAANMQQTAVVLVVLLGAGCAYLFMKKKFNFYILFQFIASVFCAFYSYFLNTSGDNPRMLREAARYFPSFASLSFLKKLSLGFLQRSIA